MPLPPQVEVPAPDENAELEPTPSESENVEPQDPAVDEETPDVDPAAATDGEPEGVLPATEETQPMPSPEQSMDEVDEPGPTEVPVEGEPDVPDEDIFAGHCEVQPLTDEFRQAYDNLDPFYQKYADADGIPIVSSLEPADEALERACQLVIDMLSGRPDVHEILIDGHIRFAIIGENELTNDIPEFSDMPDSVNQRARGLGGVPAASCAEESILCNRQLDGWRGEGICVHEFAHTIAIAGVYRADRTFEQRLSEAYENARNAGLFANTYAMENAQEYWAEGVQDWYFTNLEADPPNGIHNWVDRREELQEYDPELYALVAEAMPDEPQFVDCYSDE